MTTDQDRRAALLAAKLRALVRGRWPEAADGPEPRSFGSGAVLVADERAWFLLSEGADARLGSALAVALRAGATEIHLLVDEEGAGAVLARRAQLFTPVPTVWRVVGAELEPLAAAPAALDVPPAPSAELYRPVLLDAGLEAVVEGGHLVGELNGLEVARVVADDDGTARVEAGVGRFDREVGAMMFAEMGETDALARAVAFVADIRRPGAARHPLNQLVPERWLRAVLVRQPELVGASELVPVGSAVPRPNLRASGVATAVGTDAEGAAVVVTCSTGVDLEVVPAAADDRLTHDPDARLIIVVPERDGLAVTTDLAAHLVQRAVVRRVDDHWREGTGAGR